MKTSLFFMVALVATVSGCSAAGQQTATTITTDTAQLVLCVASHDGEPITQIALECGNVAAADVNAILNALHVSGGKVTMAKPLLIADAGH